jgi:hypothetical protein
LASGWFYLPDTCRLLNASQPHSVDWTRVTEFSTKDGCYLRAQAIFPTLRRRVTETLGTREDAAEVAAVIAEHHGDAIEQVLVEAGAAVAVNCSLDEWLAHPAGAATGHSSIRPPSSRLRGDL